MSAPAGVARTAGSRRRALVVVAVVLAGLAVLGAGGLRDALVYYRTPSEVRVDPPDSSQRFRLAGMVVPGSLHRSGTSVLFVLTDGVQDVPVTLTGEAPALLREGQAAVVEGTLEAGRFSSDLVMVKHSNEYRPPVTRAAP